MEALALRTVSLTVHFDYNTNCVCIFEDKIVTPIVKHIDITVCLLQE